MDVNLKAVFLTCQAFARQVFARGGRGRIVNLASLLSFQGAIPVCSAAADYVHGAVLNVDGGWLAR